MSRLPKSYSDRERGYIRKRLKEEAAACMGLCQIFQVFQQRQFQSTLPVWGATAVMFCILGVRPYFNPRSPCGERPSESNIWWIFPAISIHAPRVGSDLTVKSTLLTNFRFQSTLPVWGATSGDPMDGQLQMISIHAPRVGSDQ